MDLVDITNKILEERKHLDKQRKIFKEKLKNLGEKITLKDIMQRINFYPKGFEEMNFEVGHLIDFNVDSGLDVQYNILIDETELKFGYYGAIDDMVLLATFKGYEVKKYYLQLCNKIKKAKEESSFKED